MSLLSPRLQLKVAQKQILTPGLVQMVTVLQLNRLELKEMLNQEMVKNPVLEESLDDGEEITPEELQRLQDALEEEFPEDHDYYINVDTLDYLFARGVDAHIVDRFREALRGRDGLEILWRAADRPPDSRPSGSDNP